MPSGSWVPQDKAQEKQVSSNEYVYQWNIPVCSYPQILAIQLLSLPTRHFLFVPNHIKLGRACNSDVYSVLRTKAEVIFMTVYATHVNLILPRGLLL